MHVYSVHFVGRIRLGELELPQRSQLFWFFSHKRALLIRVQFVQYRVAKSYATQFYSIANQTCN